jgi:hypothetical protein
MCTCGGLLLRVSFLLNQLIHPCFKEQLCLSRRKESGGLGHLTSADFSFGWLSTTSAGLPINCLSEAWITTSDKLSKRGLDHPERCPLCDQQDKTINHLLAPSVFVRQVWAGLLQPAGLMELTPQPHDEVFEDWWRIASMRVLGQLKKGFNSLVVLGAWVIWKNRNSCMFNDVSPSVPAVLQMAREEALL